jgi:hypothetical protein
VNDNKLTLDLVCKNTNRCFALLDQNLRFLRVSEGIAIASGKPATCFPEKKYPDLYPDDIERVATLARETGKPQPLPDGFFPDSSLRDVLAL